MANKKDLINDGYHTKEISDEEAIGFAKENNAIYKIVSAGTGEGVVDLFKTIGKIILNRIEKISDSVINERKKKCIIY